MNTKPHNRLDRKAPFADRRSREAYVSGFLAAAALIEDGASTAGIHQFVEQELRPWKDSQENRGNGVPIFDPLRYER